MSVVSLTANKADLDRIAKKLTAFSKELKAPRGLLFTYRLYLLNEYKEAIAGAMGSVNAVDGGMAQINFMKPISVFWKPLTPFTLKDKSIRNGGTKRSLTIWEDSGDTKKAVRVFENEGFAGISRAANPIEYERALSVEYGNFIWQESKQIKGAARALFTIANESFNQNRDVIVEQVLLRIRAAKEKVNWGG